MPWGAAVLDQSNNDAMWLTCPALKASGARRRDGARPPAFEPQVDSTAACGPRCAGIVPHRVRPARLDVGTRGRCLARMGLGLLAVAAAAAHPALLHAQSARVAGTVALGSQLVDRGLAITPATPTVQAAASWISSTGWSVGLSASAEVRSPGRIVQTLLQGSRHWPLSGDWQMQASVLYYRYSGDARSTAYDRGEAGVNWLYRDILTFGLSASRSIGSADRRTRAAADLDFYWPLTEHAFVSAGAGVAHVPPARYSHYRQYGHYRPGDGEGFYRYGHVGLMWVDGAWRLELDRVMTDLGSRWSTRDMGAQPWIATLSRSF
ncbi:hypothetical protein [Rhodanobacter denitrificans]|nr:hypothetical protein [Rhodanobacter denitrificans]UJM86988.1 hypothetical protein LRJ86_01340 [Rhodanobacter denitrificans]